ncbi:DNA polymerase III subunit gamma/tau [Acidiphilium sp. MT5]
MAGLFDDDPPPPQTGPSLFGDDAASDPVPESAPAYRVLARKYRPTHFDDLIGQDGLVRTLRNAFAMNRIAHGFMFTGVRGVGKTTTARIIARALNCIGPDGTGSATADPCGVCANCRSILEDRHPDVIEMDAASNTGVDDVRAIIDATQFKPMMARTKVFIIDEVHMLSRNAFNALLKTLEEPPPHVKFIFATTEIRKVPITILSRCQRFDLKRVPIETLAAHFAKVAAAEAITIEPGALEAIARAADGSVRDGLSLLDQAIALGPDATTITSDAVATMLGLADRSIVFDLMDAIAAGNTAQALGVLDHAHDNGAEPGQIMQDLLGLTHTLSRLKSIPSLATSSALPELERTRGRALADQLSIPWLGRLWQMLQKGLADIDQATDRRTCADMVLIRLCFVADAPTPGDLLRQLRDGAPTPTPAPNPIPPSGGGPSLRAVANGAPISSAAAHPAPTPAPSATQSPRPMPTSFEQIVALAHDRRDIRLHAHLRHDVGLVRFAPPVIELNIAPAAPRDLASRLAAMLEQETGRRWTIAVSTEKSTPSLAAAEEQEAANAHQQASQHPLVQAVLAAFPGARIEALHRPEPQPSVSTDDDGMPHDPSLDQEYS